VVAVYKQGGQILMYDFAQSRRITAVGMRILQDNWITAMYLNNLGVQDLREGRLGRAQERLEMAVAMAGNFAMAFNSLGVVYRRQGDHERALNAYVLAMNGWGADSITASNLRLVYLRESGYDQDERLPRPQDLASDTSSAIMIRMGHAWMARGKTKLALQLYGRAAEQLPDSVEPLLARARAEMYRRQPGLAIRSLSRVLSLAPDHKVAGHLASHLKLQMSEAKPTEELVFRGGRE
jgi:tetratricopeptide (TPR) repeat protein